ncbi:hypothetical protein EDD15DRAFT_1481489 [Pisolithus albus]|nr:hypothetical protein EDD15DRAFT_1481489 [Pisolithus albus]
MSMPDRSSQALNRPRTFYPGSPIVWVVIFPFLSLTPINPPLLAVLPQPHPWERVPSPLASRCAARLSCLALSRYTPKYSFVPLILPNATSRRVYTSTSAPSSPVRLRTRRTHFRSSYMCSFRPRERRSRFFCVVFGHIPSLSASYVNSS